ncbi:hypothetical protein [Flavobacterium sp.]|uniref:hypothetical protein n=1 Tax=Flavobacterium sp. TaxID=239 RepID=UPI002602CE9F|nr:hypothetical protein [Flavobacterium sp.]
MKRALPLLLFFILSNAFAQHPEKKCDDVYHAANSLFLKGDYSLAIKKLSAYKLCGNTAQNKQADELLLKIYNTVNQQKKEAELQTKIAREQQYLAENRAKELEVSNKRITQANIELQSGSLAIQAHELYGSKDYTNALKKAYQAYTIYPGKDAIGILKAITSDSDAIFFEKQRSVSGNMDFSLSRNEITISPDEKFLISAYHNLVFYSLTDTIIKFIKPVQETIQQLSFSGDGKSFATLHKNGKITIWNYPECRQLSFITPEANKDYRDYSDHKNIAISYDGSELIYSCKESLCIYSVNDNKMKVSRMPGKKEYQIMSIMVPKKQDRFYLEYSEGFLTMDFNGNIINKKPTFSNGSTISKLSPSGKYLAFARYNNDSIVVYNVQKPEEPEYRFKTNNGGTSAIGFSAADDKIVVGSYSNGKSILYELGDDRPVKVLRNESTPKSIDFIENDQKVIITDYSNAITWVVEENQRTPKCHTKYISSASFSADGQYMVTGSIDNDVKLFDKRGKLLDTFSHSRYLKDANLTFDEILNETSRMYLSSTNVDYTSISPDGNYVLFKYSNGILLIWDCKNNKFLKKFEVESENKSKSSIIEMPQNSIIFSGNGEFCAFKKANDKIALYSFADDKDFYFDMEDIVFSNTSFSPDGKLLCFANSAKIRIIKCDSKETIFENIVPSEIDKIYFTDNVNILIINKRGSISMHNSLTNKIILLKSYIAEPEFVHYSNHEIIAVSGSHTIKLIDLASDTEQIITTGIDKITMLAWVNDAYIVLERQDVLEVWNVPQRKRTGMIYRGMYDPTHIYPILDKNLIAISSTGYDGDSGDVSIYNLKGELLQYFPEMTFPHNPESIVTSDGNYLLAVPCKKKENDGTLKILTLTDKILSYIKQ